MSGPKPDPSVAEAPSDDGDLSRASAEELEAAGDAAGLLALARAHTKGANGVTKDLAAALACYLGAARLGSAEGEYGAALFYLTGRAVAQDFKEGATRMRAAGEKGYLPAKIYVGNLYELGIHYKQDAEKASVWYRNVARQAEIDDEAESPEYARAMADIGCVRYALRVQSEGAVPAADKAAALRKARAYGYGLTSRTPSASTAAHEASPEPVPALAASAVAAPEPPPARKPPAPKIEPVAPEPVAVVASPLTWRAGFTAFAGASTLVAVATASGHLAVLGAREYVARAGELPGLGTHTELIVPGLFVALGVLPLFLFYRFVTVARASAVAALAAVVGYLGWIRPLARIAHERPTHAIIAASAGLLVTLLVLGVQGGTRQKRRP